MTIHLRLTAEKLNRYAWRVYLPITGDYITCATLDEVKENARQSYEELTGESDFEIIWEVQNWKS